MQHSIPIDHLSRAEKLRVMEALWEGLSKEDAMTESPAWHKDTLDETRQRMQSGDERALDWEQAKHELRKRVG